MPSKPIHTQLRKIFPPAAKEIWKKISSREIDGGDVLENLSWKSEDELSFFPYYDRFDVAHLQFLDDFSLKVGDDEFFGPRKWLNAPPVVVRNDNQANNLALDHLAHGADAIFFDVHGKISVDHLIRNIEWPFCSLYFISRQQEFFNALQQWMKNHKIDSKKISGSFFWEENPKLEIDSITSHSSFKPCGLFVRGSTAAREVSEALVRGVKFFSSFDPQDESIFRAIAFSLPVNAKLLEQAAKVKVLRNLWYQVSQAFGFETYKIDDLHIHCRVEPFVNAAFEPHGNMLNGTIATLAAITGGADAITVFPQNENNAMMNRIGRNVQSVLREESHLDRVADPLAGAYAFQQMVNEISQKAWNTFQSEIER